MIPIEGHKNLFRDEKTGAIVNTDQFEYDQYFKVKKQKHYGLNTIMKDQITIFM